MQVIDSHNNTALYIHCYGSDNGMCWYAKSLQSCPTLCDPIDGSPPGFAILGILQARILEWVAISFSNAWKWKVKVKSFSRVRLLVTPWTAAYQAPPSMQFSRQEYWSGVLSPSPHLMLLFHILSLWTCSFMIGDSSGFKSFLHKHFKYCSIHLSLKQTWGMGSEETAKHIIF